MAKKHVDPATSRRKFGSIPYTVVEGPSLTASDDGASATEKYLLRAQDVDAFAYNSMPPPVILFGIGLLPPRRRMPGSGILITKTITFDPQTSDLPGDPLGVDPGADEDTYNEYYHATIQYETMRESDDNPRDPKDPESFLDISMNAGGQYLSIPPTKTQVQNVDVDGVAVVPSLPNGDPGGAVVDNRDQQMPILKTVPVTEWSVKWKHVPSPAWSTIRSRLGMINSDSPKWLKSPSRKTVLFMGYSAQQSFLWTGARTIAQPWSFDFKFSERTITEGGKVFGWNHAYSPNEGRWVEVFRANGAPLHESFPMQNLFG